MSSGPGKQNTVALHPISQVHFRLSQRPPTSQKKSRLSIDHAESIEDEDSLDGLFTAVPDNDLDDLISSSNSSNSSNDSNANNNINQLKSSSPSVTEAVCTLYGEPTPSRLPLSNISNLRSTATCTSKGGSCSSARSPSPSLLPSSSQLRKSILQPSFLPISPDAVQRSQRRLLQCTDVDKQTLLFGTPLSPLRPVSAYHYNIPAHSLSSPTIRRPLLSQRPAAPSTDNRSDESMTQLNQPRLQSSALSSGFSPMPTKRLRKEGAAVCELRTVISRALSEYNMWFHRLANDSSLPLVIRQPSACLRIYVHAVETVVLPHLFRADAEISSVLDNETVPQLKQGLSLTVILSLAVCSAAAPHAAKTISDRLMETSVQGKGDFGASESSKSLGSSGPSGTELPRPLFIDLYQPLRVQIHGDDISLFVSRFQIV
ncbi:hypothetical protein FB639_000373 [Coemansia asiatica]|nr:hypothetical protein FB639_000373 [Coemansia asiatica]